MLIESNLTPTNEATRKHIIHGCAIIIMRSVFDVKEVGRVAKGGAIIIIVVNIKIPTHTSIKLNKLQWYITPQTTL
jgi:hypothetical protein